MLRRRNSMFLEKLGRLIYKRITRLITLRIPSCKNLKLIRSRVIYVFLSDLLARRRTTKKRAATTTDLLTLFKYKYYFDLIPF